ncbi:MAG: CoA transferase [Dehalococcoidales bacterium]|nr:CoA transferase [Dehalococcoidales bacterium]
MTSGTEDREMALSGIRIVDFGQGAIDPMTTSFLAGFGAEVIKVESYRRLDFIRRDNMYADGVRDPDRNYHFSRYNQNKLSVLIDLTQPKGVALAKKIVSIADVVTENFTVDVIHRLGLDYEVLSKVNPNIIMLSACFGGQTGPYREFRGQGSLIHALQGLNDLTGWPDRSPAAPAAAFGDHYLPYLWATIIIAALERRRRTGRGMFIDGSSFEGCLDVLDTAVADLDVNGRVLTRRGNRHPAAAPHGVYRCQGEERWCAITVFTDEEWQSFCRVLGNPPWTLAERFSTLTGRVGNADELDRLVEEWTRQQKAEDVMLKLQEAGVAAGVARNVKDLHQDPQLIHRGHFWETTDPAMEAFTFESPSSRLSRTPARFMRPGPLLGEHNGYVFLELLKLTPEEYEQLLQEKVIY